MEGESCVKGDVCEGFDDGAPDAVAEGEVKEVEEEEYEWQSAEDEAQAESEATAVEEEATAVASPRRLVKRSV